MTKFLTYTLATIAGIGLLFTSHVYAASQNSAITAEFGLLDLSLEIDPAVKGFSQDVSIELTDAGTGRKYQYVFRNSHNYVLPDNPIKVIVNTTYTVETYIRDTTGIRVAGADGRPVTQINITPEGASLSLVVMSGAPDAAKENGAAGTEREPAGTGNRGDTLSLIPVMDRFYEKTAYAVNGGMVKDLDLWTKISVGDGFVRDPRYLNVAAKDNGLYYDEICKVIDWEWEFYVKEHNFVDVIDEYAKLKANAPAKDIRQGGNLLDSINF